MSPIKRLLSFPTKAASSEELIGISLDLSYITPNLIVCSLPTSTFPEILYRNSINDLINFLRINHRSNWEIWNLRESHKIDYVPDGFTVNYFPWPDHESPPFCLLLKIVKSLEVYLQKSKLNTAVIHCKMGKGRSGLVAVSYLIIHFKMRSSDAELLFTQKRMKKGFGLGVSIISQKRYIKYIELSTKFAYIKSSSFTIDFIKVINPNFQNLSNLNINLQYYNKKDSLSDKLSFSDFDYLFGENGNDIMILRLITANRDCFFPPDIRISFGLKNEKTGIPVSNSYLWLNLYWESVIGSNKNRCSFDWGSFDGFKGSSKKGIKLFDSIEIFYTTNMNNQI